MEARKLLRPQKQPPLPHSRVLQQMFYQAGFRVGNSINFAMCTNVCFPPSSRLHEINKKERPDKQLELLDTRCLMKLVEVALSLLKMAPYDLECIRLKGLQRYMNKLFPATDWSLESTRPSLILIIRRIDKLFSKIHKSVKVRLMVDFMIQLYMTLPVSFHNKAIYCCVLQVYHAVDWNAAAGLLQGIYSTLWKSPYIASMPNLKSLIGTCQCLVVGEDSLTSISDHHGPATKRPELPPQSFCSIVFQLVALQVISLLLLSH